MTALYRLALRAFPTAHRAVYAAEMIEAFEHMRDARRRVHGPRAALRFVVVACADAIVAGLEERRRQRRRSGASRGHTLRSLGRDAGDALRSVSRARAFALVSVIALGLGLATISATWLLASALLHTPPAAVVRPDELYSALEGRKQDNDIHLTFLTYRQVKALQDGVPDARLFAWGQRDVQIRHASGGRVLSAAMVTVNYFDALGISLPAGRGLIADDAQSRRQVCVLSTRAARMLAPDGAVVGHTLTVNGQPFDVVGVAPARFHGLDSGYPIDLWIPLETESSISTVTTLPDGSTVRGHVEANMGWLRGGVRVDATASVAQIAERLSAVAKTTVRNEERRARTSIVLSDRIWLSPWPVPRERLRAILTPLTVAAGLTIVITSACLSGLFLGRVLDRRREFATRLALGSGRMRNVRLVAFEGLIIVFAGAALAAVTAAVLLDASRRLVLADGISIEDALAAMDARVLWDFLLVTAVTAFLSLVAPVIVAARTAGGRDTGGSRASTAGHLVRRLLLAAQVAAGCALLAGAGMLTQSLSALRGQPLGFDYERVAFLELDPSGAGLNDDERSTVVERLLNVAPPALAVADIVPFGAMSTVFVSDDAAPKRQYPQPVTRIAGPYFETLGVRLIAGRTFEPRDTARAVVIVSAPLAEGLWPGQNPVGRLLRVGDMRGRPYEIVGVVDGVRDASLRGAPTSRVYLPLGTDVGRIVLLARDVDPAMASTALIERARQLDARLVPIQSGPLSRLVRRTLEQREALRIIAASIGLGSLLMIAVGVWGLSYGTLRRRWREFGVRQAVGATRAQIGRLVLRDAAIVALIGGGGGLVAAWQFGQAVKAFLFGVSPQDPLLIGAAVAVVVAAALIGGVAPVRAAMSPDLSTLLRDE